VTLTTVAQARVLADQALYAADYPRALALYLAALASEPGQLDLRLRVADALLACGEVQRSAVVYAMLARHAAAAGYPLRALAAIKVLSALEPSLSALLTDVADLYALDAGHIGRAVRPAIADDDVELDPASLAFLELPQSELVERAQDLGRDVSRLEVAPGKLPPIPLLSELTRRDFVAVLDTVSLVRKRPGEVVIAQGDEAQHFYLVARGELEVSRVDQHGLHSVLARLHEGSVVGEMALLSRSARGATVTAATDADLLQFSVEGLARASEGAGAVARALDKFTRERLVNNLITTAPLFRTLDRTQRIDLVHRFTAHDVAVGTDLIREAELARGLYVVLSGAVDVTKRDGDEKVLLATLGPGEVFGEMSLLSQKPASATVTAAQRSTVLFLASEYFTRLIETLPALRQYLEALGDEREMDTRLWLESGVGQVELLDDIEIDLA